MNFNIKIRFRDAFIAPMLWSRLRSYDDRPIQVWSQLQRFRAHASPILIKQNRILMRYFHPTMGLTGYLELYPFKDRELREEILAAGFEKTFNVRRFCRRQ